MWKHPANITEVKACILSEMYDKALTIENSSCHCCDISYNELGSNALVSNRLP